MAIHVRRLTEEESAELERLAGADEKAVAPGLAQRARIILMSNQGWHVPQIAHQLDVHHHTVRKYVHRFNIEGMAALNDRPGRGRSPIYGREQREKVIQIARTSPRALGLPYEVWTLSTLQTYLRETGLASSIGRETIRRILHNQGISTRPSSKAA